MAKLSEEQVAELLWEKDAVIERLVKENRGQRTRLAALLQLCIKENKELHHASLRGAIQSLIRRNKQLEKLLEEEEVQIPKWS